MDNLGKHLKIFKILSGMWQVSGGHGQIQPQKAIESMNLLVSKGFITWDLADHYEPAEDLVKVFRTELQLRGREEILKDLKFFTKWVPRPQKFLFQSIFLWVLLWELHDKYYNRSHLIHKENLI